MVDEINRAAVLIGDDFRGFMMISGGLYQGIHHIGGIIICHIVVSALSVAILSYLGIFISHHLFSHRAPI